MFNNDKIQLVFIDAVLTWFKVFAMGYYVIPYIQYKTIIEDISIIGIGVTLFLNIISIVIFTCYLYSSYYKFITYFISVLYIIPLAASINIVYYNRLPSFNWWIIGATWSELIKIIFIIIKFEKRNTLFLPELDYVQF